MECQQLAYACSVMNIFFFIAAFIIFTVILCITASFTAYAVHLLSYG